MLDLQAFLLGVLLPGLLTGIGLFAVWRPPLSRRARGRAPDPRVPTSSHLALLTGVAFFASYALALTVPPSPFGERQLAGTDWLIWFALLAGPLFWWEAGRKALLVRVPLAAAMLAFCLRAMVVHHWEGAEAALWMGGLFTGLLALQAVAQSLNAHVERATMPLCLLVLGTGLALAAGLHGSARLGQTAGMACASFGAASILGFWHPLFRLRSGDAAYAVFLLFGLGACSFFFSELPPVDALLLATGPVLSRLVERGTRALAPARRTSLVVGATALPVLIVVVRAWLAFREASSYDDYY